MTELVKAEDGFGIPPLDQETGSTFGYFDRMNFGWRDGKVMDYGDWEARDLSEMMGKDYRARQIETVLVNPIISAERSIVPVKGDKGEAEWLQNFWEQDGLAGGCETTLDQIIDLSTSAIVYKRAFFEKVWTRGSGDFEDQLVYSKVAWRPQTTCRVMRSPKNGDFMGFEQEAYYVGPEISSGVWPIQIPDKRAFVHIHGQRLDPLNGSSDLEIAYWCWKTKQKILFLWFQFLENVSLPRIIVRGSDQAVANSIAVQVAKLKGSGVLPIVADNASQYGIDQLDVSGKGAEQFQSAIQWLDNAAADSVMAGFINLTGGTGNMGQAGGSLALSSSSQGFFLQSEESKTRELEYSIRRNLFAPLIRANKGPRASIPMLKFEPLNSEDKASSLTLLQAILMLPAGTANPAPVEFVSALAGQVSDYIGLDGKKMEKAFTERVKQAQKEAAAQSAMGASPAGQAVAGMEGAADAANNVLEMFKNAPDVKPAG